MKEECKMPKTKARYSAAFKQQIVELAVMSPPPHTAPPSNRIVLAVPFCEKEKAKALGARWDAVQKTWWIARRTAEENPGIYLWVPNRDSARRLKDADDFIRGDSKRGSDRDRQQSRRGTHPS